MLRLLGQSLDRSLEDIVAECEFVFLGDAQRHDFLDLGVRLVLEWVLSVACILDWGSSGRETKR